MHDVDPRETGVASALMNTAQQIGAAIGLALLTTISATAATTRLPDAAAALHTGIADSNGDLVARAQQALSHGYTTAYLAAAVLLVAAAVIAAGTVTTRTQQKSAASADTRAG